MLSVETVDGTPIADDALYTLAASSFVAGGGGGYTMLVGLARERLSETVLDALVTYLQRLPSPVVAPDDPRIAPGRADRR